MEDDILFGGGTPRAPRDASARPRDAEDGRAAAPDGLAQRRAHPASTAPAATHWGILDANAGARESRAAVGSWQATAFAAAPSLAPAPHSGVNSGAGAAYHQPFVNSHALAAIAHDDAAWDGVADEFDLAPSHMDAAGVAAFADYGRAAHTSSAPAGLSQLGASAGASAAGGGGYSSRGEVDAGGLALIPTTQIPHPYSQVFSRYKYFNRMQSQVFDSLYHSDRNVAVAAPTSTGKTVVFELAMLREIMKRDGWVSSSDDSCDGAASGGRSSVRGGKMVYLAPLRALADERYEDWRQRFAPLGVKVLCLTGDFAGDNAAVSSGSSSSSSSDDSGDVGEDGDEAAVPRESARS